MKKKHFEIKEDIKQRWCRCVPRQRAPKPILKIQEITNYDNLSNPFQTNTKDQTTITTNIKG